jgi:DsbC/DsbD-like thiol-disulfide interchange protein
MTTLLALLALATFEFAQKPPQCGLSLFPFAETFQPGKTFQVALRFRIQRGWHIYWVNPGDSGVPTEIKWTLPPGFKVVKTRWSGPKRIDSAGIVSYGLEGDAYAIATIQSPPRATNVAIKANADWLICKDICLEGKGSAVTLLQAGAVAAKPSPAFARAAATIPADKHAILVKAQADAKNYRLEVRHATHKGVSGQRAYFYPFADELADHSAEQVSRQGSGGFTLTIPRSRFEKGTARRLQGILEFGSAPGNLSSVVVDVPIR